MFAHELRTQLKFRFAEIVNIIFAVNHTRHPVSGNGAIAWERVSSIKIIGMEIKSDKNN